MRSRLMLATAFALLSSTALTPAALAQGPKGYAVTPDQAVVVVKGVLMHQGFRIVRLEKRGSDVLVYYRRGNMGKGKGQGPPMRLVIRRIEDRVVFEETPADILVDIDVHLRLP